jgi:hypothetical protein
MQLVNYHSTFQLFFPPIKKFSIVNKITTFFFL